MENNDSIAIAAIKERKELLIEKEENLEPQLECCVYRVPKDLCKVNEEAYTPKEMEVKYFTDLKRYVMTKIYPKPQSSGWLKDLPVSVKLDESGVKFKNSIQGDCLHDVRFEKKKRQIPWLGVSELQIPLFGVYDETECIIRNVMASE